MSALETRPPTAGADTWLGSLILNGSKLRGEIAEAVTAADLERTIDGCTTLKLTLHDQTRAFLRSPLAGQANLLSVDGLRFRMTGTSKSGDDLTLTFEEEAIWALRRQTRPRKASRARVTRAQFFQALCREVKTPRIPFWCPETSERQRVGGRSGAYEFTRGSRDQPEDSWTAMRRMADEVAWRVFCRAGTIVFARDQTLLRQPVALKLTERSENVDAIDFDYDPGKRAQSATITCRIDRWSVPPGSPVQLSAVGTANGTWLVESISRSLYNPNGSVVLTRPQAAKLEPPGEAPQAKPKQSVRGARGQSVSLHAVPSGGIADIGRIMVQWACRWVPGPYVFGANHIGYPAIRSARPPFDCSSFAAAAAAQVGVDIVGTTFSQIGAGRVSRAPHGSGGAPPGGWLPGDLIYPYDHHVCLCMGNGHVVHAHCTACGIEITSQSGPYLAPYFWWRVAALSPQAGHA
jgi:cell wall-associated NlpC family hydrolase